MMNRIRLFPLAVIFVLALSRVTAAQAPTPADPADAFFDDTSLQDINFSINSKDWDSLREHFKENTYYPLNMTWKGQTVRSLGIRSRGTGSRSGTKPGL